MKNARRKTRHAKVCPRKARFASFASAYRQAKLRFAKDGALLEPYRCSACGRYHLAHARRRKKAA